jgi:surface antigen
MTIGRGALVVAVGLALAGCEQAQQRPGATAGAVLGGIGGAVAGAQIGGGTGRLIATAAGGLLGAWLGSEIGARLDERDQMLAEEATYGALEQEQASTWENPDSGYSGTVTPVRTYDRDGRVCREFEHVVHIEGRREVAHGTACRDADGRWEIV